LLLLLIIYFIIEIFIHTYRQTARREGGKEGNNDPNSLFFPSHIIHCFYLGDIFFYILNYRSE
jgi:hypothetical protein